MSSCKPETVLLKAPAKLNLGLQIVGRREDGFHELQSLFWPIDLCDSILLEQAAETSVICPGGPEGQDNLVYRALELVGGGWKATINKRIPMGGGLGGGSSNAGCVLSALARGIDESRVVKLGADVPFFLKPVPTWVEGIGERRTPLALDEILHFLLVFPPKGLSTPEIFRKYRESGASFSQRRVSPPESLASHLASASNDLIPAAISIYPLIGQILDELSQTGPLFFSMTGTGSTCFAVYASLEDLEKSAKVLQPFLRTNLCRSLVTGTYRPA